MNENEKRRYDALEILRKAAWTSFDHRRPHEWKVCISLWTAMAAFIGIALSSKTVTFTGNYILIQASLASALLVLLHIYWIIGIGNANRIDRLISYFYSDKMKDILDIKYSPELEQEIQLSRSRMGRLLNWSHTFQLGVTITFCLLSLAAIKYRM